jgi:pyruvate dehydrogenase E2 component (dihydrolipoamide acetyltransferase)
MQRQEVTMAVPVIMPRQGQSVESCIITKWNKKKGDKVNVGDILFSYETDKASFEEEAKVEGTLLEIFFNEGDDVPCLLNVCVIGNEGESTAEFNPNGQSAGAPEKAEEKAEPAKAEEKAEAAAPAAAPQIVSTEADVKISPRARHLAEKSGVDVRYAAPTGPNGRIIERDIVTLQQTGPVVTAAARDEYLRTGSNAVGTGIGGRVTTSDLAAPAAASPAAAAAPAQAAAIPQADYREVKLTNIRKVIAKSMQHSLSSTAQLTLNSSFDATDILAFRKKLKDNKDALGLANITLNDIILYAVSRTLLKHENINANLVDDKMLIFNNAHLGIAVDTERGLMVPTLFNANHMSLNDISINAKKLIDDCQKGMINPDLLKGASFTITNLGSLDIESFTPVLNPPQTGILGVDNITYKTKQVN